MTTGPRTRAYETIRGGWATAFRALSFVLILALVVPGALHSVEAHRTVGQELALSDQARTATTDHAEACPACDATCGCHQALNGDGAPALPTPGAAGASYAVVSAPVGSVSPDRLSRPPRA